MGKEPKKSGFKAGLADLAMGEVRPEIFCPHCQTKGQVRMKPVKVKKGISGGKATGALFTFGTSMLVTGLSRKERHYEARCGNCKMVWTV